MIAPVALINPLVNKLAPVTLPLPLTVVPEIAAPVIAPVALINPLVNKLAADTFPVVLTALLEPLLSTACPFTCKVLPETVTGTEFI